MVDFHFKCTVTRCNKTNYFNTKIEISNIERELNMDGTGHQFNPYIIRTADDLINIKNDVYGHYILNNNISLVNEWSPIPNFYGCIDGRGYIISNLTIRKLDSGGADRTAIGFIGFLRPKSKILNLTIVTSSIGVEGYAATYNGVLSAQAYSSEYGFLIENVSVSGNIQSGGDRCGGLIGFCDSKNSAIKNCVVNVKLSGGTSRSGAIIGYLWDTSVHASNIFYSSGNGFSSANITSTNISNFNDITQYANKLDFTSQWAINPTINIPTLIIPKKYIGLETVSGFVEGVIEPIKITLTDKNGNELESQVSTDFEFIDYDIDNLNGNIKIGDKLTPIVYYQTQGDKGYLSASVSVVDCTDSDFTIHCFRNSDKQFIGEYQIIDGRYTIDNLNLNQTYDIMLYDKNSSVETQVHSRRTPSVYQ